MNCCGHDPVISLWIHAVISAKKVQILHWFQVGHKFTTRTESCLVQTCWNPFPIDFHCKHITIRVVFCLFTEQEVKIFLQSIPQMLLIKLKWFLTRKNDRAHYFYLYIAPPLSRLSRLVKACWGVQAFCQSVTVFISEEFMLLEAPSVLCCSCLCESVPLFPEHYPESEFLL